MQVANATAIALVPGYGNLRMYRWSILEMPPLRGVPQVTCCFGARTSQAAWFHAEEKLPTSGVVTANAVTLSAPSPGIDASRQRTSLCLWTSQIASVSRLIRSCVLAR